MEFDNVRAPRKISWQSACVNFLLVSCSLQINQARHAIFVTSNGLLRSQSLDKIWKTCVLICRSGGLEPTSSAHPLIIRWFIPRKFAKAANAHLVYRSVEESFQFIFKNVQWYVRWTQLNRQTVRHSRTIRWPGNSGRRSTSLFVVLSSEQNNFNCFKTALKTFLFRQAFYIFRLRSFNINSIIFIFCSILLFFLSQLF